MEKTRFLERIQLLEKRIESLEIEQEDQDKALSCLRDLEELLGIKSPQTEQTTDEGTVTLEITAEDIEAELALSQPKKILHGYVILLANDSKNLVEWSEESGGGWREIGMGTRYENPRDVKDRLKFLKRQWPTYPLKITKV